VKRAIRDHLRDFIAIGVLAVLAVVATGVILVKQQANFPSWAPIVGQEHFELKAEFSSAQAVTPGQGQTVNLAGIKVGSVESVNLENDVAVVTMDIDPKYAPLIHRDASLLLRPRTGLQDMTIEIDPGTTGSKEVNEGSTVPLANTQPNVNPDQVLASLDGDTQSFLQLLLQGAAQGLYGHSAKLSAGLRRFEPTVRDIARINSALAERRQNLRRVITNFGKLSTELGHRDTQLARFVRSSDAVLGSFAKEQGAIRSTLQEFPPTLRQTQSALTSTNRLALILGPASRKLIPSAQALAPALRQVRPLFEETKGPIENQIRPFARKVQTPLKHINQASQPLADTTTSLSNAFNDLNLLLNALAYNSPGSADEGYLFWLSWLNHDSNALFFTQDAGGPVRHGLVMLSCATSIGADQVAFSDPFLWTLQRLSGVPDQREIHNEDPANCPAPFFFGGDSKGGTASGGNGSGAPSDRNELVPPAPDSQTPTTPPSPVPPTTTTPTTTTTTPSPATTTTTTPAPSYGTTP
jgi:phospholipid/cholesterol/gamma-HCH transport system substrate-binding protein